MERRAASKNGKVQEERRPESRSALGILCGLGTGLLKVLVVLGAITLTSLCFLSLYNYLLTSPYMKLHQVVVEGVDKKTGDELIRMCGLTSDTSVLGLNLVELKRKMEKHPWIRSVTLKRKFPHTLRVKAEREVPRALVKMDRIYYMNRWGEIFKAVEASDDMDFPIVTGVSQGDKTLSKGLYTAARVMEALEPEKGMWSLKELSEVHIDSRGNLSLYFNHLATEIKLSCEHILADLKGLKKVGEHLVRTDQIHHVNGIDLSYGDGAVVSFKGRYSPKIGAR
jgi:cell division protein FtsQ